MNYLMVSFICVIALLGAVALIKENGLLNKLQKRKIIALAFLIIFEIFVDTIAIYINGLSSAYVTLFKIIKICEFIVAPLLPTVFACLICRRSFWEKIRVCFYIVIVANTIVQLINIWYPLTFIIDANSIYTRTSHTYLYILLLAISFTFLIICSRRTFTQDYHRFNSLGVITLFFIIGIGLRCLNIESNADWLCITFSYFLFMEYFSNSYYQIDEKTGVRNQKSFMIRKSQIDYSTVVIAIDVNYFKTINDTKGHLKGDECLGIIGKAISSVYSDYGVVYRPGGDEFAVIFNPDFLENIKKKNHCDVDGTVINLMKSLDDEMILQAKNEPLLISGVAQGYDIYKIYDECDDPKDYRSFDEVYENADRNMYVAKRKEI